MPIIPSGNTSLLELIDSVFEQKYGNATVDPLEVDTVHDAVSKAFKAHDLMLYVESLDGTEKRLTYQQSDEDLVWRTLLTGKLEHEPDPAVFQRTVYVRDDDASTFLKKFTGKGFDRPTGRVRETVARTSPVFIKTGGAGSAAEPPGLRPKDWEAQVVAWFVEEYVPAHADDNPHPTRDNSYTAARKRFSGWPIKRDDTWRRKIWANHAPTEWKKRGPR